MADPYLDPATGILSNKLGLTDDSSLLVAEAAAARLNATTALTHAEKARYLNEQTLRDVHRILLGDIYEWAGEFRTVYLKKAEGGPGFTAPDRLAGEMKRRIMPPVHRWAGRAG